MRRSFSKAFAQTLSGNLVLMAAGLFTGIVLARDLGPAGRGQLAAITLWTQLFATLFFLSVNDAIVLRVAGREEAARQIGRSALVLGLSMGVVAAGAIALAFPVLLGPDRSQVFHLARSYAAAYIPLQLVYAAILALVHGVADYPSFNRYRVAPTVGYLAGIAVLWQLRSLSVTTALVTQVGATLLALLLVLGRLRPFLSMKFDTGEARRLLAGGLRIHGAPVALVLTQQMDRLAIARFFPDSTVGLYMVASTYCVTGLSALSTAVQTVSFQRIGAHGSRVASEFVFAWRAAQTLLLVATAGLALLAPYVVPWLFGEPFRPSAGIALLLCLPAALALLREVGVRCARAVGAVGASTAIEVIVLAVFLLAGYVAIQRTDVALLVGAYGLACLIGVVVLATFLVHRLGIRSRDLLGLPSLGSIEGDVPGPDAPGPP